MGYHPWGRKELEMTEQLNTAHSPSPSVGHMHVHCISRIRVLFTHLLDTQGWTLSFFGILCAVFPCPAYSSLKAFLAEVSVKLSLQMKASAGFCLDSLLEP